MLVDFYRSNVMVPLWAAGCTFCSCELRIAFFFSIEIQKSIEARMYYAPCGACDSTSCAAYYTYDICYSTERHVSIKRLRDICSRRSPAGIDVGIGMGIVQNEIIHVERSYLETLL